MPEVHDVAPVAPSRLGGGSVNTVWTSPGKPPSHQSIAGGDRVGARTRARPKEQDELLDDDGGVEDAERDAEQEASPR